MSVYFADTSFWIALIDNRDQFHHKAIERSLSLSGSIVTTEAVIFETANIFSRPDWRSKAIALINHIRFRPDVEVVCKTWLSAWDLFCSRSDKSWSLTDCVSFQVMKEREIIDALTSDAHFRQAGFHSLLLDD